MPMSGFKPFGAEQDTRQRQLLGLGRLILQQSRAGQWDAVRLTDRRLAHFIQVHMLTKPALWSALKPERELVRSWHQEALSMCQQETALRKQEWHNLSLKREGLRAYDEVQEWT